MRYKEIVKHYENCFKVYGDNHKGVDWPNESDALTRYAVMAGLLNKEQSITLLDLGCGAGHFLTFLEQAAQMDNITYTGADLSEVFIDHCQAKFPERQWIQLDLLHDNVPTKYDYIIMNGLFTEKLEASFDEMWQFFTQMLIKAWDITNIGMAFNVMSTQVDWQREDLFHVPMDLMGDFLHKNVSRNFTIRRDYGLYEYTVYVFKSPII